MGTPTPRDELINRLVDRRPACASQNMYRSGDYDFIILLAFVAAVVVVFVLFFQYDFGQRVQQRVVRTTRRAAYYRDTTSTGPRPDDRQAVPPGALREVPTLSEPPPFETLTPEERAVPEEPITAARAEEPVTMMAPLQTERTFGTCDGPGCREMAEELRATLDDGVSPCGDFYQHVCGKWVRNHTPELGEALVSEHTLRHRRLESQLLVELRSGTDDGSLRWPLRLWRGCSTTTGEPNSHDVLRTIFAAHGLAGFPFGASDSHRDISVTAANRVLSHSGLPALIDIRVVRKPPEDVPPADGRRGGRKKTRTRSSQVDARPSRRWVIRVGAPQPLFRDFVSMRDVHDEWFMAAVQSIAGTRDMPEMVEIERALVDLAGQRAGVDDYVAASVARLQRSRLWNWTRFLRTALDGVTSVESRTAVLVKGGSFQRRFAQIVEKFGSPSLHNYLALRMYVRYAPFLDWKRYRALVDVATARLRGWEDVDPPEHGAQRRCLRFLSRLVPEPFAYMLWNANIRSLHQLESELGVLTDHVVDETLTLVRALNVTPKLTSRFGDVVSGLKHQLLVPAWMRKPSLRMKFSELVFSDAETSPIVSWNAVLRATWRNAQRRLIDRGFETSWRGPALGDEPWLDEDEGYLAVPPASVDDKDLTGDAFYALHLPKLGLDLARAVVGLFLRMAARLKRRYPAAHLRLELLADCLRRQFYHDKQASELAAHHDAIDVIALPSVLHAFRKRLLRAQGNGTSTSMAGDARSRSRATDRLFFYEFARSRCEAYDDAYLHQRTHRGARSPAPFFVNGPLRNTKEFARAFRCPRDSDMRPKRVCRL
ncbi:neprilysin-2-like isoform X1 [Dermacentor albipictus]|uniref:neprilysin-2-like isoform X1 n=1 Tax=Dermacentor albipictus TaxID=60249 RepID=UPI0038FC409A